MRYSRGGITLDSCDAMYQSEYELHMLVVDHWEEEIQQSIEKLSKDGLGGMLAAILFYGGRYA